MANYFGPGIEVAPIAPAAQKLARWQSLGPIRNMVFTPRPDSAFASFRRCALGHYLSLARTAIENAKDVISNLPRQIRAEEEAGRKEFRRRQALEE